MVPSLTGSQLSLRQRLSEGAFGTVYVADAIGLPEYGGRTIAEEHNVDDDDEDDGEKRLVAVKFLSDTASEQERSAAASLDLASCIYCLSIHLSCISSLPLTISFHPSVISTDVSLQTASSCFHASTADSSPFFS